LALFAGPNDGIQIEARWTRKKDPTFLGIKSDMIGRMEIFTIDLHSQNIPQTIASYLVIGSGGPVLVETGPGATLETLKASIRKLGYSPGEIKHVLVTHIHFDHAGASGWWAQQGAQVYVHHIGAKHLIDPSRLMASATRIYGDNMDALWGTMLPAPPQKVTPLYDGDIIAVAGLRFQAIDTPGHANHHHAFCLEDVAFLGDVGGVRLPQSPLISLPAPPPEFDLEAWQQSIDRLRAKNFSAVYPTHFGPINAVETHFQELKRLLNEAAGLVRRHMDDGKTRDQIIVLYQQWHQRRPGVADLSPHQRRQYLSASPLHMSVDGIMRYWKKKAPPTP
jgi:glyoxylase-like metal-dependent hydrolase (beta-lactamase superfamily II)